MAEVIDAPQKQEPQSHEQPPPSPAEEAETKDPSSSPPPPPPSTTSTPPVSSFSSLSLSIWPPSQRTRTAVLNRLVETLSSPSVLSNRYGSLPADEASSLARQIEDEAFSLARQIEDEAFSLASSSPPSPDDDGMAILQIYSREISKRMLDAVKARAAATASTAASSPAPSSAAEPTLAPSDPVSAPVAEEISSVESESSQA